MYFWAWKITCNGLTIRFKKICTAFIFHFKKATWKHSVIHFIHMCWFEITFFLQVRCPERRKKYDFKVWLRNKFYFFEKYTSLCHISIVPVSDWIVWTSKLQRCLGHSKIGWYHWQTFEKPNSFAKSRMVQLL